MQIWLALLALIAIVTSPLMAADENFDTPQPEAAPSANDYAVPVPQPAEAAVPQADNTTDSHDVETAPNDSMISVGPDGFGSEIQPN